MHDPNNPSEIFARPWDDARFLDFEHFTFWANTPNRKGFRCRLVFGERNGNPRITHYPNLEKESENEKTVVCSVGFDPMTFWEFLRRFELIIRGPEGGKDHIENRARKKNEDGTPGDWYIMNSLRFGKDEEGVVWIAIQDERVPNVRYLIENSAYHNFFREDGTRVSRAEGSKAYAMALVDLLRRIYVPYVGRLRAPFDKEKMGGKGRKRPAASSSSDYEIAGTTPKRLSTEDENTTKAAASAPESSFDDDDIPY